MVDTTLITTSHRAPRRAGAAGRVGGATNHGRGAEAEGLSAESRWQRWAACRKIPTALFFPTGSPRLARGEEERAKTVCSACPVRARCLAFAFEHDEAYGVWGGLNPEERRALAAARPRSGEGAE